MKFVMVEDAPMMIFKGDWICKGRWLDQVVRAKYWHTVGATVVTVRMKNVLHADLLMSPISDSNKFVCVCVNLSSWLVRPFPILEVTKPRWMCPLP
jgi:hypothetical protein